MLDANENFYTSVLSAGAILTGFAGTFLQFRIGREASYYRQPFAYQVMDKEGKPLLDDRGRLLLKGTSVYIGQSHFTSALLLLLFGTILAMLFGLALPLLALIGSLTISPRTITVGLEASLIFLLGYFCSEMVHYRILKINILEDLGRWGKEWAIVLGTFAITALTVFLVSNL